MSFRHARCALTLLCASSCTNLSIVGPGLSDHPDAPAAETVAPDLTPVDLPDSEDASDASSDIPAADASDASEAPDAEPIDVAPMDAEDVTVVLSDVREPDVRPDVADEFELLDIPSDASITGALPSVSSAIAITPDDRIVVAVNRTAGSVSVMLLGAGPAPTLVRTQEFSVGADSEPCKVVIAPDGDTAYALLRRDQ